MKFFLHVVAVLWLMAAILPAHGQTALDLIGTKVGKNTEDVANQEASTQDLQELLRLLSNPALVEQLIERSAESVGQPKDDGPTFSGVQKYFQATLIQIDRRARLIVLALTSLPQLSGSLTSAWNESMATSEFLRTAIHVIIFLFGGFGLEWLYWSYLSGTLKRIELSKPKTYGGVLRAAWLRATLLFGSIAIFGFGQHRTICRIRMVLVRRKHRHLTAGRHHCHPIYQYDCRLCTRAEGR